MKVTAMENGFVFTVGQQLYWAGMNNLRTHGYVTAEKVGRKWVQLSNGHRINRETMRADAGHYTSPGRCYLSKDDYDNEMLRDRLTRRLKEAISNCRQFEATSEDIVAAGKLLGISIEL